jgi:Recombination endonuclease VII
MRLRALAYSSRVGRGGVVTPQYFTEAGGSIARMSEPACWSWPVPDLHERVSSAARAAFRQLAEEEWYPLLAEDVINSFAWWIIDPDAYRFAEFHAGRCAMCGKTPPPWSLFADHDHKTSLVRGFLCRGCNTAEAHRANRGNARWQAYRDRSPAVLLGYVTLYSASGYRTRNTYPMLCARGLVVEARRRRNLQVA